MIAIDRKQDSPEGWNRILIAKDQEQYNTLPAWHNNKDGVTEIVWKLSFKERLKLLFTGFIYHRILRHGRLQPVLLSVNKLSYKNQNQ